MTVLNIGAWFASCLHLSSPGQDEITKALKQAQEQNSAANQRNLEASKTALSQPIPMAKPISANAGIDGLLSQIRKGRKRRDEAL